VAQIFRLGRLIAQKAGVIQADPVHRPYGASTCDW
jgi:hypothetical protein